MRVKEWRKPISRAKPAARWNRANVSVIPTFATTSRLALALLSAINLAMRTRAKAAFGSTSEPVGSDSPRVRRGTQDCAVRCGLPSVLIILPGGESISDGLMRTL